MRITKQDLIDAGACREGVESFEAVLPEGWSGEWTRLAQEFVLGDPKLRKFWGWAVVHDLIPAYTMRGWDLRGANLQDANLQGANLQGANLEGAIK